MNVPNVMLSPTIHDIPACFCGNKTFAHKPSHSHFMRYGKHRAIVTCLSCGVYRRWPAIKHDQHLLADIPLHLTPPTSFSAGQQVILPHLAQRLQQVAALAPNRLLLDVGAGNGVFMRAAQRAGWTAMGIEIDPTNQSQLANEGLNVHREDVEAYLKSNHTHQFGFIHMNHVLEHISDPLPTLQAAYQLLAPKGVIVIEVPSEFDSLLQSTQKLLGMPGISYTSYLEHEYFFTRKSLQIILEKAGFHNIKVFTPARYSSIIKWPVQFLAAVLNRGSMLEAWGVKIK